MLTKTQIEARQGKLTASRVAALMEGNAEKILRLYHEMIGEEVEEDLSHIWAVRLGEVTEQLQLDWMEEKSGKFVTRRGEVVLHSNGWAAATLDGWIEDLKCPVECKHVGGREPLEVIIDRYQPQMQWQMEVTGSEQCALSVIMGANEPVVEFIERHAGYAAEMVRRGQHFMDCVRTRTPPVALPAVPAPIDASKVYNMEGVNEWANYAGVWLETKETAERCEDAKKILKSLVPEDAKKCHGHRVQITRDRANRLSLREIIS